MIRQVPTRHSEMAAALEKFGMGNTSLMIEMINGVPFVVDQNGQLIHGVRGIEFSSGIRGPTVAKIEILIQQIDDTENDV